MVSDKRRQQAGRVAKRLSLEKLILQVADVLICAEGNIIQNDRVSTVWHCGVKEPIMLDTKDAHQLGRACRLSKESMTTQLKMEDVKWAAGSRITS